MANKTSIYPTHERITDPGVLKWSLSVARQQKETEIRQLARMKITEGYTEQVLASQEQKIRNLEGAIISCETRLKQLDALEDVTPAPRQESATEWPV